jgi:putative redox protein
MTLWMLRATSRSIPGSLRQRVVVDGRHVLVTDEPEHLGGTDTGPAPHELVAAAVAACVSTTLVMYAEKRALDLGGVEVEVDYDNKAIPRRCDVRIRLGRPFTDEELAKLEKVAAACPVRRALEGGVVFEERIEASAPGQLTAA